MIFSKTNVKNFFIFCTQMDNQEINMISKKFLNFELVPGFLGKYCDFFLFKRYLVGCKQIYADRRCGKPAKIRGGVFLKWKACFFSKSRNIQTRRVSKEFFFFLGNMNWALQHLGKASYGCDRNFEGFSISYQVQVFKGAC